MNRSYHALWDTERWRWYAEDSRVYLYRAAGNGSALEVKIVSRGRALAILRKHRLDVRASHDRARQAVVNAARELDWYERLAVRAIAGGEDSASDSILA